MDIAIQRKQQRLRTLYKHQEYHGWFVQDNWVNNQLFQNKITGEYIQVSYLTKKKNNPLPFKQDIQYRGVIHTTDLFHKYNLLSYMM